MPEVIGEIQEEYIYLVKFSRNSVEVPYHGASLHTDITPVVLKQMWSAEIERGALDNWKRFKNTNGEAWSRRNEEVLQLYKQNREGERIDIEMRSEFEWEINSWREVFSKVLDSLRVIARRKSRNLRGWKPKSMEAKKR